MRKLSVHGWGLLGWADPMQASPGAGGAILTSLCILPPTQPQVSHAPSDKTWKAGLSHRFRHESGHENKPLRPKLYKENGQESYTDGLIPQKTKHSAFRYLAEYPNCLKMGYILFEYQHYWLSSQFHKDCFSNIWHTDARSCHSSECSVSIVTKKAINCMSASTSCILSSSTFPLQDAL